MVDHLYRISHKGKIRHAFLKQERFYFTDSVSSDSEFARAEECKILTPTAPTKIIGVGLNYRDHALERNKPIPTEPLLFLKPPTALLNPGESIVLPEMASRVDPEGELAVVIRATATRLRSPEEAGPYIWGYSCFNDVTARDLQDRDVQFTRAKGFDTFAPYGPCIAVGLDASDLAIRTSVNGKVRQASRTSQLIFPPHYLVWYISQIMTLLPGDVIATGTPAGIAPVHSSDNIRVEIESIGALENPVL